MPAREDDGNFTSPAADVHDHVAPPGHAPANRRSMAEAIGCSINIIPPGAPAWVVGILTARFFHFRDARRHCDHDSWRNQFAMVNLLDDSGGAWPR